MKKINNLDPFIEKYYTEGNEKDRLLHYRLEKDRTLKILISHLPPPPAVILDIGGGAGVYSFFLAEAGYEVHLIDPIARHINQAKQYAKTSGIKLASYSVGDAREIKRASDSADVILLFGPLYHLIHQEDRLKALSESYRLLKPRGLIFAAGISRFASFMDAMHKTTIYSKMDIIEEGFVTGVHKKVTDNMVFAYLHYPEELRYEVKNTGFENVIIRAIEGPIWEKHIIDVLARDPNSWEKLLTLLEKIDTNESIIGASAHIMAIGSVRNPKT